MGSQDYWIGDSVRIVSSDFRGSYEGQDRSGMARVKCREEIRLAPLSDLEPFEEPAEELSPSLIDAPGVSFAEVKPRSGFEHVIDLHYEKLAPERLNNPHPHILEFQLEKCREYLDTAKSRQASFVRIIHGRGQGKLKAAVEALLLAYPGIRFVSATPDSGALEVWFR